MSTRAALTIADSILKSRLATDEKHLKRVTKRLSTLAQASSTDEQCVPFVLTGSDAMFQMLKVDLALFRANLGRLHTSAHATTERDVATYKAEAARLGTCEADSPNWKKRPVWKSKQRLRG